MALDVRDPEAHRAAAAAAAERGRLDVWVNNAGVMRTVKTWEHSDDEVRLMVDANFYGVMWGSRAAVDAMRAAPGGDKHLINIGSLSSLAPVPGLAVYGATKHGVLGFSESLQGDLMARRHPHHRALRVPRRRRHRAGARRGPQEGLGDHLVVAEDADARRRWPTGRLRCSTPRGWSRRSRDTVAGRPGPRR